MKRILSLVLPIMLFSLSGTFAAQWRQVNSGTSEYFNKVCFPSVETGYVIGFHGIVLKTTDGGTIWNPLLLPVSQDSIYMHEIFFVNDAVGWVSGAVLPTYKEKLFKTTDGGSSWSVITPDSAGMIGVIHFYDEQHGFVCGSNYASSEIWTTSNGGATWEGTSIGKSEEAFYSFTNVAVPDSHTIYLGGGDGTFNYKAVVAASADGGRTWKTTPFEQSSQNADIQFFDAEFGYALTAQKLMRTSDGGATWDSTLSLPSSGSSFYFLSPDTGFVLSGKEILQTNDGGRTFSTVFTASEEVNFTSIRFTGRIGYAVGSHGTIVKYAEESTDIPLHETGASFRPLISPQPLHRDEECILTGILSGQEGSIVIVNMLGQVVAVRHYTDEQQIHLRAGDLFPSSGMYIVRIVAGSREISSKVIVY